MPRPWTETRTRHGPRARGRLRRVTAPLLACGPSYRTSRGFRPRWLHVAPSAAPPSPRYFIPCRNALGSPLSPQRRPQNQKRGPRPHPHSGGRPRAPLPSATLVGRRRPRIGEPGREALPTRRALPGQEVAARSRGQTPRPLTPTRPAVPGPRLRASRRRGCQGPTRKHTATRPGAGRGQRPALGGRPLPSTCSLREPPGLLGVTPHPAP